MKKLLMFVLFALCAIPTFAQVDTAWVRRYSGPGNSSDEAYDLETDFSISVTPDTLAVPRGYSGNYKVILTSINGFASNCTLTVVGYPNGATATFDPPKLVPTDSSILTLTIPANTPEDTFTLTITGTEMVKGKGIAHSKDVTLIVTLPVWMFEVEASPDTQIISQGGSTTYGVTIIPNEGFIAACTLFVEFVGGLPSGVTADFGSNPIPPNDTSTLTITTQLSTPYGEYDLAIIAVANKKQKDTTYVKLIIEQVATGIRGNVKDASQQNLQDVLVEALQDSIIRGSNITNSSGQYAILGLASGSYNVRATKPGYETKTYNAVQVIANQTTTQDFNLNPSPADTVFYDDFSDGNADGWDTLSRACDWSVPAGQYILTVPGEHRIWCFSSKGDINLTDYIYEADVYGIHGVDKVICFRFIDRNNFYAVNLRSDWGGNDEVTINKMQGGTFTADIVSVPYPSQNQTLYHLKVEVSGTDQTNIKVWVEDNQLINWTDPGTPITHGKIAVAAYSGDYGGSTGLPTEVGFTNVLVACPSFDLTVDIPENFIEISNNVTDLFVAYFSLKNNGLTTIHNIETIFDIGGNTFPHTFSSLDPGKQVNENSSIHIPSIWENQNVTISVTSIGGCPVDFHDSKQVSVYYCTGGSDSHPFTIERDSYNFRNPKMDWKKWRQFFSEFSPTPGLILSVLPEFILGWRGHCFGMSASAAAYFRDPSVKPLEEETHAMDLWQEGVFHNIIRYHVAQFLFGQFYSSFVPMEATEAEAKAKELITENKPPLVALPPIELAPPFEQRSSKGAEGHTVTGYKLLRDLSLGTSLLYLYDNEDENTVQLAKFDLNDNTFTYGIWHSTRLFQPFVLYSDEEWLKELWNWLKHEISDLWDRGLARFGLGCPAKMLLTDEYGRRVGFVDGITFINEIPEAEVTFIDGGNGDTLTFYDVPMHLNYTVKYFGSDLGYMDIEVLKPTSDKTAITLSYVGVAVTPDMITTLQVDSTYDYTLKIDRDGNGTIDTVVNPTVDNLAPTPFDLLSPADQQTVLVYPFGFHWASSSDLNGDSVFYRVYVGMDSSFSSADSSVFTTDTSWTCTISLKDSTNYFWKVKAFDNKGGASYSEQTWSFFLVLPFMYGDANGDGVINVSDIVYLINYLFINGPTPQPLAAGDVNCDGTINVSDVVYLINYLFISGPPPCR